MVRAVVMVGIVKKIIDVLAIMIIDHHISQPQMEYKPLIRDDVAHDQ